MDIFELAEAMVHCNVHCYFMSFSIESLCKSVNFRTRNVSYHSDAVILLVAELFTVSVYPNSKD